MAFLPSRHGCAKFRDIRTTCICLFKVLQCLLSISLQLETVLQPTARPFLHSELREKCLSLSLPICR